MKYYLFEQHYIYYNGERNIQKHTELDIKNTSQKLT